MDPTKIAMDTVTAIASSFLKRGVELSQDKICELIKGMITRSPGLDSTVDIESLTEEVCHSIKSVGRTTYNEETLARYLEIPVPDLYAMTPDSIDLSVLFDHIKLEQAFAEWLNEWGYMVEIGHPLGAVGGMEYLPDVYGILSNLHGEYEVCINFVCDKPPSEDRVFALLAKIETYSEAKPAFSSGDIFMVITPHNFTLNASKAIALQNEQEKYYVFHLDGGDIFHMERSQEPEVRLEFLRDKVRLAQDETERAQNHKS